MRTKYYKQTKRNDIIKDLQKKFYKTTANHVITLEDNGLIVGGLDFELTNILTITYVFVDNTEAFSYLFSKLIFINYEFKDILMSIDLFNKYRSLFKKFDYSIFENQVFLKFKDYKIKRYIEFGRLSTGKLNNICDVDGVKVGHFSINQGNIHTGITAIIPHSRNIFREKVIGATYVYNGFGKSIGLTQIDELGTIETPILLTNTLNVGKVAEGLVEYTLNNNPEIGITTGTLNPVVLECNDGTLNDIRQRPLDCLSVKEAIENSKCDYHDGNIGAGSGMTCHGFKGGIGSSSRVIEIDNKDYTLGILVNSNFLGSTPKHLVINNHFLGDKFTEKISEESDKGSIIIVFATDIPLSERQLKRILKRTVLGIGKTGGFAGNGSGDIIVGFSTANIINHFNKESFMNITTLNDNSIDKVFKATVDATEEAIINSLLNSKTTTGVRGNVSYSINEYIELFDDLFIENIFKEK